MIDGTLIWGPSQLLLNEIGQRNYLLSEIVDTLFWHDFLGSLTIKIYTFEFFYCLMFVIYAAPE